MHVVNCIERAFKFPFSYTEIEISLIPLNQQIHGIHIRYETDWYKHVKNLDNAYFSST